VKALFGRCTSCLGATGVVGLVAVGTPAIVMLRGPLAAEAGAPPAASKTVILLGDGIGKARFGQSERVATADLGNALSETKATVAEHGRDCTIDMAVQWPALTAYFYQGRFVGYSTFAANGEPLPKADMATAKGLRVGDTLGEARRLYDGALRTTLAQGGAWFAKTPNGTLEGYLSAEVNQESPPPRIASIEAGHVGCPAATP